MSYDVLAVLCLVVGILLLVTEFFVPSGGLIGILCLTSLVVSVWAARSAWYGSSPGLWYSYLLTLAVLLPGSVYALFQVLQNTEYGQHVFLVPPSSDELTPYAGEERRLEELVGVVGTAETDMLPTGVCRIDGERVDCVTDGPMISAGIRVTVIGHRGVTPVVRPAVGEELTRRTARAPVESPRRDDPPASDPDPGDEPLDPFAADRLTT
jgi:membrane-bound ClpP family serine protease